MIAPRTVYTTDEVLPALRELFSQHPPAIEAGPEMLGRMLFVLSFLNYQPSAHEVEEAREALVTDGELFA